MGLSKLLNLSIWLPSRRLSWKIMAPYVVLSVVVGISGTLLVTRLASGSLEERFTNQLAEAARSASDAVVRRERDHLEVLRSITFTEGLAEAVREFEPDAAMTVAAASAAAADVGGWISDAAGSEVIGYASCSETAEALGAFAAGQRLNLVRGGVAGCEGWGLVVSNGTFSWVPDRSIVERDPLLGLALPIDLERAGGVARLVLPHAANGGAEFVEILDAFGNRVFGARLSDAAALQYETLPLSTTGTTWPVASRVISRASDSLGDKFAQLIDSADGPAMYTAGPLFYGEQFVGVVVIGSRVESFLTVATREALADLTVYDLDGRALATSFPVDEDDPLEQLSIDGAPVAGTREARSLFERGFAFLYFDLSVRGEPAGFYSVALPESFITGAIGETRLQLAVLFASATVAVLVIGWLLARLLTVPLLALARTARAVANGDLSARTGLTGSDEIAQLAETFDLMTAKLQRQHLGTLRALVSAIDARDPYTRGHSVRVGQLARTLGVGLGLQGASLQHLLVGGYLHDIGKIGIRDAVLLKPGALNRDERRLVEEHPTIGLTILESVELPAEVLAAVGGHHERLGGQGYPDALRDDQVTIYPRIVAVADVFDAVITDRPYRAAMELAEVLDLLDREVEEGLLAGDVVAVMRGIAGAWVERMRTDETLEAIDLGIAPAGGPRLRLVA